MAATATTPKANEIHESVPERNESDNEDCFSLCEYDMDVVDDALLNPESREYLDHFGFTIQVKTDDEYDEDTSDESDFSDNDQSQYTKPNTFDDIQATSTSIQHKTNITQKGTDENRHVGRKHFTSFSSDDDTDLSVDTAITTPTICKDNHLSMSSINCAPDIAPDSSQVATQQGENNMLKSKRGRSMTASKPTTNTQTLGALSLSASENTVDHMHSSSRPLESSDRTNALTISSPLLEEPEEPDKDEDRLLSEPEANVTDKSMTVDASVMDTLPASKVVDLRETTVDSNQTENEKRRDSNGSRSSTGTSSTDMSYSKRISPLSYSHRSSVFGGTTAYKDCPSRAFQERQSKRRSEIFKALAQSSVAHGSQTSDGSSSYYDMLMTKFGRTSQQGHRPDSPEQVALKEEINQRLQKLKETSAEDYDWDFWMCIVSNIDKTIQTDTARLRDCLSVGLPPSLRGLLWQLFSRSRDNKVYMETEYKELLSQASPQEKVIVRDLSRTFPTHEFFREQDGKGQEVLFNVIKAYSLFDQQVGYCQGLPFVAGCLLLHMPDEEAFCTLVKLLNQYGLRGHFLPNLETFHERLYQFEKLLEENLPQVHRHLDAQGVKPTMYASQWFMTLFAYRCPFDLVFRVFDLVFLEGLQILLNFALALMKRNQQTIVSLEFESLLTFFANQTYEVYKDDPQGFVRDAYSFTISPRQLTRLSKQYATVAAQEAKLQTQENGLRQENMELSKNVRRLEKSYKTLQTEHQEVTKQLIESKIAMARTDNDSQQLRWEINQVRLQIERAQHTPVISGELKKQFDEVVLQNAELVERNGILEDQLAEVERALIDFKLKYAESENEYEIMKQKLSEAQRLGATKLKH
ncbi:GTPase-activating protein [Apophysomyces sp. BC1034]|nr:GTPase-activating protein [Apophysomyces sp. BC1015]KAG0176244.1 GTPase-activating protein [Apophysomyces sp. BC1021]KAG0186598.1 GTPase-activating protein [Apophysomyces sp. BC1034]